MQTIIRKTDKGRTRTEYKIYTLEDARSGCLQKSIFTGRSLHQEMKVNGHFQIMV
jgi:hypothetical protein